MVPVITDLISDYMHQKQTFQNRSPQPITHKFKLQYLQSGWRDSIKRHLKHEATSELIWLRSSFISDEESDICKKIKQEL